MMDWRAISRSRSRMAVDWRPTSRSRSRPPLLGSSRDAIMSRPQFPLGNVEEGNSAGLLFDSLHSFGVWDGHQPEQLQNGPAIASDSRNMSHPIPLNQQSSETSQNFGFHLRSHSLSELNTPIYQPSSLPSYGFYGPVWEHLSSDPSSFPRRVRKTSFDHTVSKDGILPGEGRHQVNGKPLSPTTSAVRLVKSL
jgi:GATA-binding protein, other eukaryote